MVVSLNNKVDLFFLAMNPDNLRLHVYAIGRLGMVTETWTNYNETGTKHFFLTLVQDLA